MIIDFSDANKAIHGMERGTDDSYIFKPTLENGSTFVWGQYTVVCEGRLAIASALKNFNFPVSSIMVEGEPYVKIDFPKTIITTSIRESKVYWKVLATHLISTNTILLNYGELWLK
jgi:hypothetical protein